MAYISLGNPIWSGQGQLLGGLRRAFFHAFFYAGMLLVAFMIMRRLLSDLPLSMVAAQALGYLAWIQWGLLLVGGTAAVLKALNRDQQTRMIESLRIAPLGGLTVVVGYAIGPALSVLLYWCVGLMFGVGLTLLGGATGTGAWVMGHLLVLLVAIWAWTLQVFFGVGPGKPVGVAIPLLVACFIFSAIEQVIRFGPGFALFVGGHLAIASRAVALGQVVMDRAFAASMFATVAMLVFWAYAVAARFRRPYLPALSVGAALVLLALFGGVNILGLHLVGDLYPRPIGGDTPRTMGLVVMHALLIFLCLPISAAAQIRRRTLLGATPVRRTDGWPPVIVALLAALIALGTLTWVEEQTLLPVNALRLPGAVGMVSAALLALGVFKITSLVFDKSAPGWVILVLLWGAPLAIAPMWDAIAAEMRQPPATAAQVLFVSSPPGALLSVARGDNHPVWWGWPAQLGLAGGALLLALRIERSFVRQRRRLRAES